MAMNEAVPRLSAEPFSGIMGILENAAIECLSINIEPITIEKLSSESLYSCGGEGGWILLSIAGLRQKRRCSTSRVFSGIAFGGGGPRESRDITDVRRGTREDRLSSSGKLLLLEDPILFRVMKVRR